MTTPIGPAPNMIIYAIPGSQFVFKVLAAFESRGIPHYVHFVSGTDEKERKRILPSGLPTVPELQIGLTKEDRIIVSDSENILHYMNDDYDAELYPTDECSKLSERASDHTLAGMVWYYNWVNQKGYENSMQKTIANTIFPTWLPFRTHIIDIPLKSFREKHRKLAINAIGLTGDEKVLDDEQVMRKKLIEELLFFQKLFKDDKQTYMIPNEKGYPSAVDFSVYAQVERLICKPLVANDVEIFPAVPELEKDIPELNQL